MATPADVPTISLIALPRAVLSVAAGVLDTVERAVVGDSRVRTARGNAWDAMCADRARAQSRAEMQRLVAALAASMPGPSAPSAPAPAVADQMTAGQITAGRMTAGRMTAGRMTAGQMTAGQMTAGQMTAGQMTAGQTTGGRTSPDQLPAGQLTVGSSPRSSASHAALVSTGPTARN
jgi:hypothetical protein